MNLLSANYNQNISLMDARSDLIPVFQENTPKISVNVCERKTVSVCVYSVHARLLLCVCVRLYKYGHLKCSKLLSTSIKREKNKKPTHCSLTVHTFNKSLFLKRY